MKILLRIVEGAKVALFSDGLSEPELLPTRYDLFKYRGGVAWGYKGSGVQNLAYAIAARLLEDEVNPNIDEAASSLVENLLSGLMATDEHTITQKQLSAAVDVERS